MYTSNELIEIKQAGKEQVNKIKKKKKNSSAMKITYVLTDDTISLRFIV